MPTTQANVEYWFRLLYNCIHGYCYGSLDISEMTSFLTHVWLWIIIIGYTLSVIGLFVIVYTTMRLFELRKREEEFYNTIIPAPGAKSDTNSRWKHIESLADGATPSEWREAIIEADIMLDDILAKQGFVGDGVGEKLKSIESSELRSLQDAWEAHKVRNQIAHEGSAFELSDTIAHRTISRYASVFNEFKEI